MSHDVGNVVVRPNAPVAGEVPVQGSRSISRPQRVQDIEALVEGILDLLIELQQKRAIRDSKSVSKLTEQVLAESKKQQDTYCTKATMIHTICSVALHAVAIGAAFKGGMNPEVLGTVSKLPEAEGTVWSNVFDLSYQSTRKGAETHQGLYNSERGEEQDAERKNQQQLDTFSQKLTEFYAKLTQIVSQMR